MRKFIIILMMIFFILSFSLQLEALDYGKPSEITTEGPFEKLGTLVGVAAGLATGQYWVLIGAAGLGNTLGHLADEQRAQKPLSICEIRVDKITGETIALCTIEHWEKMDPEALKKIIEEAKKKKR
jgi:proteasome assembly chaperone (PAC2) family protein